MSEPDPSQNAQGLLLIYESVREEIIARIRMRRRLVGFSFAFITAIIGYALSGDSTSVNVCNMELDLPTNAWIVAVVSWVIGIVVLEILRSERILRKAGTHLQEIEQVLINTPGTHGWETASGGQSPEFSNLWFAAASLLVVIYVMSCLFSVGIIAWMTASAPFTSVLLRLLVISYVVLLLPSIWLIYQMLNSNDDDDDDDDNDNNNESTTESTDQSLSEDRTHSPDIDKNDTRLPRV